MLRPFMAISSWLGIKRQTSQAQTCDPLWCTKNLYSGSNKVNSHAVGILNLKWYNLNDSKVAFKAFNRSNFIEDYLLQFSYIFSVITEAGWPLLHHSVRKSTAGMTAITPLDPKFDKNARNDAITPLGPKVVRCYSQPLYYFHRNHILIMNLMVI